MYYLRESLLLALYLSSEADGSTDCSLLCTIFAKVRLCYISFLRKLKSAIQNQTMVDIFFFSLGFQKPGSDDRFVCTRFC